jgi:hypothetical protein
MKTEKEVAGDIFMNELIIKHRIKGDADLHIKDKSYKDNFLLVYKIIYDILDIDVDVYNSFFEIYITKLFNYNEDIIEHIDT